MQLPSTAGVYVVALLNDDPISVNADRQRIADQCISVTRANCKVGRAVNLARRQRNYEKTFGIQNVRFAYFYETDSHVMIEKAIKLQLNQYRIPGRTGRPTEWLQGLSVEQVCNVVKRCAEDLNEGTTALPSNSLGVQRREGSGASADEEIVSPAQIVSAAKYLSTAGMDLDLLRDLHHFPRRTETYRSTISYFSKVSSIQGRNRVYGSRLVYVANAHQRTGRTFESIVIEALERYKTDA